LAQKASRFFREAFIVSWQQRAVFEGMKQMVLQKKEMVRRVKMPW
jgi:hypothetical protein